MERKTVTVTARLTPTEKAQALAAADRLDTELSMVLREAVNKLIRKADKVTQGEGTK